MTIRSLKWLMACTVLMGLTQTAAQASIFLPFEEWTDGSPVALGDKEYTYLSSSGDWDGTVVRFDQSFAGRVHTLQLLDLPGGNLTLEYKVEVAFGPALINSIGLSVDWTQQTGVDVLKTVYDLEDNLLGSIEVDNGVYLTPDKFSFSPLSGIRVVETITQEGAESRINSMSNTITQVVPEPSTWLLGALAAGGVAVIRLRRSPRKPQQLPTA